MPTPNLLNLTKEWLAYAKEKGIQASGKDKNLVSGRPPEDTDLVDFLTSKGFSPEMFMPMIDELPDSTDAYAADYAKDTWSASDEWDSTVGGYPDEYEEQPYAAQPEQTDDEEDIEIPGTAANEPEYVSEPDKDAEAEIGAKARAAAAARKQARADAEASGKADAEKKASQKQLDQVVNHIEQFDDAQRAYLMRLLGN